MALDKKTVPTEDQIRDWLAIKVAEHAEIEPDSVDTRAPFAQWGLDSIVMVSISGELEEWLERRLAPTLLYDYPSIDLLAKKLAEDPLDSQS